jgi:hypothetical protein
MVPLLQLWLPILLAAALVFVASSIIHMVLGYHASDYGPLPDEESVRPVLRVPPGQYVVPYAASMKAMQSPEYMERMREGPTAFIVVGPSGELGMGRSLGLWFAYCLAVSVLAAYLAGRALPPGAPYLEAFRFAGTVAFAGYAFALWQNVIWYRHSVGPALKNTFDGLVFALITGGVFGWLWPGT